jgi:hypothetical protein
MASTQEKHRGKAQEQQTPDPTRIFNPKEGAAIQEDVTQSSAAECRHTGHDADPDRIQAGARCREQSRKGEGNNCCYLYREERMGQGQEG